MYNYKQCIKKGFGMSMQKKVYSDLTNGVDSDLNRNGLRDISVLDNVG
jgi:hypothetical protein